MLTSADDVETRPRPAYRSYDVTVRTIRSLSPHFTRVTFTGDELEYFGTHRLDQRIKIVLPLDGGYEYFPRGDDWYGPWRELPTEQQNAFRTYTVRDVRPELAEVDIDFVSHGDEGPASRWVSNASVGDALVIVGPDARSADSHVGIDWRPGDVGTVLLAGDETAAPAICSIVGSLDRDSVGAVFIEVPSIDDTLEIDPPAGVEVRWLGRDAGEEHGSRLVAAVREWTVRHIDLRHDGDGSDFADVDLDTLWEVPEGRSLDGDFYAWLAGEASTITALRRFLVRDAGLDRRSVAFMGYWRRGRAEGS